MKVFFFGRFHVFVGMERVFEEAVRDVLPPSRDEPGCLEIHAYRSLRDPQLFYIHSRWESEEAFEIHAKLPHTVKFLDRVQPLMDHPFDPARTEQIG